MLWPVTLLALAALLATAVGSDKNTHGSEELEVEDLPFASPSEGRELPLEDAGAVEATLLRATLSDGNARTGTFRAKMLLRLVHREHSPVLLDYWERQPADKWLVVYRSASRGGKYVGLLILQPFIFVDVDYLQRRNYENSDYPAVFYDYISSLGDLAKSLPHLFEYLYELPTSKIAKILRGLTGTENGMQLQHILDSELPRKMAALRISDSIGCSDYVILDENLSTWESLDRQILQLDPDCLGCICNDALFPPELVVQHLMKRAEGFNRCVEAYRNILEKVLKVDYRSWLELSPKPTEHFTVECFWKLLVFLEREPQYGGFFGYLIVRAYAKHEWGLESAEQALKGLANLVWAVVEDPESGSRHQKLCSAAELVIEEYISLKLTRSDKQFRSALSQFVDGMFAALDGRFPTLDTLLRDVLRVPATLVALSDLQVDVVAEKLEIFLGVELDASMMDQLKGYTSEQLSNLYETHNIVSYIFKQPGLREMLQPDCPFRGACLIIRLSRVYEELSPACQSVLGSILELTSAELKAGAWPADYSTLSETLWRALFRLRSEQDFTDLNEFWQWLEQVVYQELTHDQRIELIMHLTQGLKDIHALDLDLDSGRFGTFNELLSAMAENAGALAISNWMVENHFRCLKY